MKIKKIILIISIILVSFVLYGCGDKDYTDDDATKYANRQTKNPQFISSEVLNDRETIWTFYDKKFDITFFVKEKSYKAGIDATYWDARKLVSNYDKLLIEKELLSADILKDLSIKEEDDTYLNIYVDFKDRQSLEENVSILEDFLKDLDKKTKRDSYNIKLSFRYIPSDDKPHSLSFSCNLSLSELKKITEDILLRALIYQDDIYLKDFSNEEISSAIDNSGSQVCFVFNSGIEKTGIVIFGGSNYIKAKPLYRYLEKKGTFNLEGDEYNFSFTDVNGKIYTFTEDSTLGFYDIPNVFGCKQVYTR